MCQNTLYISISLIFISYCAWCDNTEKSKNEHPLALYSIQDVRSGKIKGKELNYLKKYTRAQLLATNKDKLINTVKKLHGDFGIPASLPKNQKLLEFLRYSADHFRVPYLHLGTDADRRNLYFTYIAGGLRDLWIYYGNREARDKYLIIMKYALRNLEKLSDKQLRDKIDERGLMNFWHPLMKSAALYYARIYEMSGNEYYAKRACIILERFGEVLDKWKLYYQRNPHNKEGRGEFVLNKRVPKAYSNYGLWGWWGNVHGLNNAKPLLDAYLLIKRSASFKNLPDKDKKIIVNDLLYKTVEKHLYLPFQPLHNQSMNRISGMIYFGKRLNRPEYIHTAFRWINEMIHLAYRRDGLWFEGTESYGISVSKKIIQVVNELRGWSDPSGFKDPVDGKRFDNFKPEEELEYNFKMIKNAFNKLALPDGRSIPLEDTIWDAKNQFFGKAPKIAEPFLFGASGIGMLGFGKNEHQVRLYLHWDDSAGHDHMDMLGIALWAENQEICSETGYRGTYEWNKSTAAHNTVMIDEKNQPGMHNRDYIEKKANDIIYRYPHYKFGQLIWNRSCYDDAGELLLWDVSDKDVQLVEVNGRKAFKKSEGINKYQRTLVLVRTGKESFYIVDIFRIKGGKVHDWMLHGNLGKNYDIKLLAENGKNIPLKDKNGKIGKFMTNLKSSVSWNKNLLIEFAANDKKVLRSIVCGYPGTEVIVAEGPSVRLRSEPAAWGKPGYSSVKTRYKVNSKYLSVRRHGPDNIFIAVHEALSGKSSIKGVEFLSMKDPVKVKVKLKGSEDIIESSDGRIKYSSKTKVVTFGSMNLTGKVFALTSMDRGDEDNSFTISGNLHQKVGNGELIIILDGDKRRHPYIIKKIIPIDDNRTKIIVKGETGMLIEKKLMIMTYYPSWDISGKLTYLIPGKQKTKK